MGQPKAAQIALWDCGIPPEEVLVRVHADARPGRRFIEGVDYLVFGIVAEVVHENPPGGEGLVSIPAEAASAAVAHGNRSARSVLADSGIRLEHAGHRPLPKERRCVRVVIDAFTPPRHLAEEEPLIEEVVDVVALGPAAAGACQFHRRGRPVSPVLLQTAEGLRCPGVLVVARIAGQPDPPVLVSIPAVVEDMGLGSYVGLNRLVHILVKPFALPGGPVVVAEVVHEATEGQVGRERNVSDSNRPVDVFHGPFHSRQSQ